jgi:hypothetical protein
MRIGETLHALCAAAARGEITEAQRAELRDALDPVLATAAHGLRVAADALDGPDPEVAALYLIDALDSLDRALARTTPRLPA